MGKESILRHVFNHDTTTSIGHGVRIGLTFSNTHYRRDVGGGIDHTDVSLNLFSILNQNVLAGIIPVTIYP